MSPKIYPSVSGSTFKASYPEETDQAASPRRVSTTSKVEVSRKRLNEQQTDSQKIKKFKKDDSESFSQLFQKTLNLYTSE